MFFEGNVVGLLEVLLVTRVFLFMTFAFLSSKKRERRKTKRVVSGHQMYPYPCSSSLSKSHMCFLILSSKQLRGKYYYFIIFMVNCEPSFGKMNLFHIMSDP